MLKEKLKSLYYSTLYIYYMHQREINKEKKLFSQFTFPKLTSKEAEEIKQVWHRFRFADKHIKCHRIYKAINGFDPYYLTVPLYNPLIIRSLNSSSKSFALRHKGLFQNLFPQLKQPQSYVRRIGEQFYDGNMSPIGEPEAIKILVMQDKFIVKPCVEAFGNGIQIIQNNIDKTVIKNVIADYEDDFIAQEIVCQHIDTGIFNPSSLNTIRILSLFINGQVSILKSALRCGQNGAIVDNAEAGGLMIKINKDGMLNEWGIDGRFQKIYQTNNGVTIKGRSVPNYQRIEEIIFENHAKMYPFTHLVGWDWAIDADGKPVFIEGNTITPGIFWIQLCAGPIFGERTQEVIEYVKKHPFQLNM